MKVFGLTSQLFLWMFLAFILTCDAATTTKKAAGTTKKAAGTTKKVAATTKKVTTKKGTTKKPTTFPSLIAFGGMEDDYPNEEITTSRTTTMKPNRMTTRIIDNGGLYVIYSLINTIILYKIFNILKSNSRGSIVDSHSFPTIARFGSADIVILCLDILRTTGGIILTFTTDILNNKDHSLGIDRY